MKVGKVARRIKMIFRKPHHNGIAIVLSWPETECKQTGAWYEPLMKWIGINKNGYYTVGHSAIVLISDDSPSCEYYDFGRYHAPIGHGRIRNCDTDHDLVISTLPILNEVFELQNEKSILQELCHNKSCHGTGHILSSSTRINVDCAKRKIKAMRKKSSIPYGPLIWNGTNCSRFIASVLRHGNLSFFQLLKLNFQITLSASPVGNVKALNQPVFVTDTRVTSPDLVVNKKLKTHDHVKSKPSVLPEPSLPQNIDESSHWLAGEGAGSWFAIQYHKGNLYNVNRYSPNGTLECEGIFSSIERLSLDDNFEITYPSHCQIISLMQNGQLITLTRVGENY